MNKLILMGRLIKDPEIRYTQGENQTAVARFGIAVDRRFARGEKTADFFNSCVAFGKQAEFIERYLKQGTKVLLTGRLQNDNYTNKDGQMVYRDSIFVDEIEFAESKRTANDGAPADAPNPDSGDGFMNIPDGIDDELPFN